MWEAVLRELREAAWVAAVAVCLSAFGVAIAIALAHA